MDIKFNCPKCGLAMQASTDNVGGTAQCPECGQQFVVEASPPVMPVVRAQAVPTPADPGQPPPRNRPPQVRPGPAPHPHAHAAKADANEKARFIGLAVAGVVLLILVIWLLQRGGAPKSAPAADSNEPTAEEISRQIEIDAENARRDRELKAIKERMEEEEKRKAELAQEELRKEHAAKEEELAAKQAEYRSVLNHYAKNAFGGDAKAAEAFMKVWKISMTEFADLMNDGNTDNDPKTQAEAEGEVVKRMIRHFDRDPVLSQWMKDHERDPKKFIPELVQRNPRRPGSAAPANAFDFTKYASSGSGFWISPDGWILTNEHVVTDAKVVDLRLRDGRMLQATVVKTDDVNDLALLKADLTSASWLAVSKGEIDLQLGRTVFTVGYPDPRVQGVEPKFTDGRISAASGIGDRKDSYQTTVPVQHGNSGGALVDFATGWVVGVVNAKLENRRGVSADNVSYAIKGKVVSSFFESVPEAKAAVVKTPPKPLTKGDERAVIDRATDSAILILRQR